MVCLGDSLVTVDGLNDSRVVLGDYGWLLVVTYGSRWS